VKVCLCVCVCVFVFVCVHAFVCVCLDTLPCFSRWNVVHLSFLSRSLSLSTPPAFPLEFGPHICPTLVRSVRLSLLLDLFASFEASDSSAVVCALWRLTSKALPKRIHSLKLPSSRLVTVFNSHYCSSNVCVRMCVCVQYEHWCTRTLARCCTGSYFLHHVLTHQIFSYYPPPSFVVASTCVLIPPCRECCVW
jgi:hypothetical protein